MEIKKFVVTVAAPSYTTTPKASEVLDALCGNTTDISDGNMMAWEVDDITDLGASFDGKGEKKC